MKLVIIWKSIYKFSPFFEVAKSSAVLSSPSMFAFAYTSAPWFIRSSAYSILEKVSFQLAFYLSRRNETILKLLYWNRRLLKALSSEKWWSSARKCNGVIFCSFSTALTFEPLSINSSMAIPCPFMIA